MQQEEMPEWRTPALATATRGGDAFAREFDARLGGRVSLLTDFSPHAPRVVADAYRAVLGLTEGACSDDEAIDRLLNPARNPYRLETLNIGVHAPIMRALQHANFTFAKKISHTADSQDQRHRMVPGSRPLLALTDTRSPDFVTPMLIAGNARAREVYERAMADAWAAKNELLDRGAPAEIALYLLPNAKAIRLVEIRLAAASAAQMDHAHLLQRAGRDLPGLDGGGRASARGAPSLGRYLGPPCYIRAGNRHADLHRRLALLRRESLAGISRTSSGAFEPRISSDSMTRRWQPRLLPRLVDSLRGFFLTIAMFLQEWASPQEWGLVLPERARPFSPLAFSC